VSDTPRTDEQINGKPCTQFGILAGDSLRNASVPSEFARTIERELNAANDRIKRLEEDLMDAKNQYAALVADVALYEDRGERIKRLEEALDTLTLVVGLTPFAGNKDALQEAVDLARAALRAKEAKL
jgi:predicted  nucleic acid-binding Zn-ribbon protein